MTTPASKPLKAVEIFHSGTHRGTDYDRAFLKKLEENFEVLRPNLQPPLVVGHEETQPLTDGMSLDNTGIPALGTVSRVWTEDRDCPNCECTGKVKPDEGSEPITCPMCEGTGTATYLLADFDDVHPLVHELISQKALRSISAEIYDSYEDQGKVWGPAVRRISALGGEIPQLKHLKGLAATAFVDDGQKTTTFKVPLKFSDRRPTRRAFRASDGRYYFPGVHKFSCRKPHKFAWRAVQTRTGNVAAVSDTGNKVYGQQAQQVLSAQAKQQKTPAQRAAQQTRIAAKKTARAAIAAAKGAGGAIAGTATGQAIGRINQARRDGGKLGAAKQALLEGGKVAGDAATRALTLGWSPQLYSRIREKHGHTPAVLGTGAAAIARTAGTAAQLATGGLIPGVGLAKNLVADAVGAGVGWTAGKTAKVAGKLEKASRKGLARAVAVAAGPKAGKATYRVLTRPPGARAMKRIGQNVTAALQRIKDRVGLMSEAREILAKRVAKWAQQAEPTTRFAEQDLHRAALRFISLCESAAKAC